MFKGFAGQDQNAKCFADGEWISLLNASILTLL